MWKEKGMGAYQEDGKQAGAPGIVVDSWEPHMRRGKVGVPILEAEESSGVRHTLLAIPTWSSPALHAR